MERPLIYCFDGFTLDVAARQVRRDDEVLLLEPKSFRLLQFLIENRDRVLGKEEIFREVWNESSVTDNALTRAIAQIRKALEDDPRQPRFIETLPTVGYRFIGKLITEEPPPSAKPMLRKSRRIPVWAAIALTVLAVTGLAAWRFWPKPSKPAVSPPVPLTTYRGNEDAPSFSPDGNQVAFQWDSEKQDNLDIYVKTLGPDATPLRLTNNPLPDRLPSWSPDGRTIAFLRVPAPGQSELILIPALGGPERKLARFPIWEYSLGVTPAWSPNGRWIVVPVLQNNHAALFRFAVDTGESTQITIPDQGFNDEFPDISPDGKTLLFVRHPTFYRLGTVCTVLIDDNAMPVENTRSIPSRGLLPSDAHWIGDGTTILAHTPDGVFRVSSKGIGDPQPIPWLGSDVRGIALSPQGKRLAYTVVRGDANVWRIDLAARIPQPQRLIASTFRDVYPQFSPDGRQIAFQSNRGGNSSNRGYGKSQIWVGNFEGGEQRQLTFMKSGLAGTPHWSPDGRTLLFDCNTTGHYQIYTIDPDGGRIDQVTNGNYDSFDATWSRDGVWLYFTSNRTGRNEIWKMRAAGGDPVQMTHNGGWFAIASEDGKTLYFGKSAGFGSIWKMPATGGREEQLANSLYRGSFAVSKRGIYYMSYPDETGISSLKLYSFATGSSSTILQMGRPEYGLDVSPNGRYLAYAQLDDSASDLMLVENFR
jgi:Tol biopolymer transport system component/DNA-binding winged helix-turn-helix (wHTH) protein